MKTKVQKQIEAIERKKKALKMHQNLLEIKESRNQDGQIYLMYKITCIKIDIENSTRKMGY
jgi:hypothetical protein